MHTSSLKQKTRTQPRESSARCTISMLPISRLVRSAQACNAWTWGKSPNKPMTSSKAEAKAKAGPAKHRIRWQIQSDVEGS